MNDEIDGSQELLGRLRAMGQRPVDPALAAEVLGRARRRTSWWRSTKLKVASAAAGGLLLGSVGLASAGTLPRPVQDVAHHALGAVGVDVPVGTARYNDPTACPGGPYRNHGAYVKAHTNDPAAADSPCGKPLSSVNHPATDDGNEAPGTAGKGNNGNDGNGNGNGNNGSSRANSHASPNGKANSTKGNKGKNPGSDDANDDNKPAGSPAAPNTTTTVP